MNEQMYTVFNCTRATPCNDCDHLRCVTLPNHPRKNLAGTQAIATGVFEKAPDAHYLTQAEAAALMQTPAWTHPEPSEESDDE